MKKQGYKVGVLDADITGPSIPRLLGVKDKRATYIEQGILPVQNKDGIKIISLKLIKINEDDPVIWRGPMLSNMVKQFWTDVIWEDLDYLLIDMPPNRDVSTYSNAINSYKWSSYDICSSRSCIYDSVKSCKDD